MKNFIIISIISFLLTSTFLVAQPKVISECTVVYELSVEDSKTDPEMVKAMKGTVKTLYIKGTRSRSDLISPNSTLTILNDTKNDTTIILRESGNAKYISYLTEDKVELQNKKFAGITFTHAIEKKTILGYECKKVVAKLKDGSAYNVYYAPSIVPSNNKYEYQFKDLAGFVLEYETETVNGRMKYSATKITFTPVPSSKLEVPKSGYRVL